MSGSSKKERKLQQLRNRRRRELAAQEKRGNIAVGVSPAAQLRFDESETSDDFGKPEASATAGTKVRSGYAEDLLDEAGEDDAPRHEIPAQEQSEADLWWHEFSGADGSTRLAMTRAKLETVSADDDCFADYFPEAVYELESKLSSAQYVAFLEELREVRHDVFLLSADWNTRSMVFEYLAHDRLDDVDQAVFAFAAELEEVGQAFFSLMSTIRLAGRAEAAQQLIDAATARLKDSQLMYWAVGEVLDWAMFPHYQRCVAAGATDDAIEEVHAAARKLGIEDSQASQANRRAFALHLSGQSNKQWTKEALISSAEDASHNIYLLSVDYMRWLISKCGFEPIVADEFRRLVNAAIDGIDHPFNALLFGMSRRVFEPHLVQQLGFMSLNRIHAPAKIVAMKHYFDFLKELGLTKPGDWQKSQSACDALWKQLRSTLHDEWQTYRFLERYLPA